MFRMIKKLYQSFGSMAVVTVLLIVTSAGIGFVTFSVLTSDSFGADSNGLEYPTPRRADAALEYASLGDPDTLISFKDAALGFRVTYPRTWQKGEQGLQVVLSPSVNGLNPSNLRDAAIWFGIPADNTADPGNLLAHLRARLAPQSQASATDTEVIGGQRWQSTTITFEHEQLGGPATAKLAATSKNDVGYYAIAVAPAGEWAAMQPAFAQILDSFEFTAEAVLRPTDATPPPTPTATPTPIVHVVQYGDTLGGIAVTYGVDLETLSIRNGIDDPRRLQVGAKLVIPRRR